MKITVVKTTVFMLLTLFVLGCGQGREMRSITDRAGRSVTIHGQVNRIISTAPSNTEIIADLGLADKLIAIDRHSTNVIPPHDYPGIPDNIPLLDFFFPDPELIIGLEPDLIIASGHNPTGSGDDPFRLLGEMGIPVVYVPMSRSIEDIYLDIAFVADLLSVQQKGEQLVDAMKAEIAEIIDRTVHIEVKNSVYFEIAAAPEMFTVGRGNYLDDMISAISAINIFGNDNWLVSPGAESIIERNPDVILTNVNYIDDPIAEIKNRPGFNHINAVINDRIYFIDTDSSVRPSRRITIALRQMSQAVYP